MPSCPLLRLSPCIDRDMLSGRSLCVASRMRESSARSELALASDGLGAAAGALRSSSPAQLMLVLAMQTSAS
jgi:hypothetical protein